MATTSTAALAAPGATGTLALTGAAVIVGTASLPVYAGVVPNASVAGIYLQQSPDFVGGWVLYRHPSGVQAPGAADGPPQRLQNAVSGDNTLLNATGAGPIARLIATDSVTLNITSYSAGSMTMTVVQ